MYYAYFKRRDTNTHTHTHVHSHTNIQVYSRTHIQEPKQKKMFKETITPIVLYVIVCGLRWSFPKICDCPFTCVCVILYSAKHHAVCETH